MKNHSLPTSKFLFAFFLFFISSQIADAQNYQWANGFGSAGVSSNGKAVVTDAAGNVYTTGYFSGTVDFDPGPATANLISKGSTDIFVSKSDAFGNYIWAKAMGGTSQDIGYGIALDAAGNVYTTGSFYGTADFDPGTGTANLTSLGLGTGIFISKLDASGNYIWAKVMGATSAVTCTDVGYGIAVDVTGNVYTTGYFNGTADFNPAAGTANLVSAGGTDIFVSKLDASGNYVWAKAMGGTNADGGYVIAVDVTGNVYTTGYFNGTADFNPAAGTANLISAGSNDIFISKLDASGNYVWAKAMGGTSADAGTGIALDAAGNVFTTGYFNGTADFNPGAGTANLVSAGGNDIFVSKLDASGNYIWAKAQGGTSADAGYGIALDVAGNLYTTGYFAGTADFDPGAGTANLISAGGNDIFVSKLDASGNYVWAKAMGGTGADNSWSIAVDAVANVITTGQFVATADFDANTGTANLTAIGNADIFVSKLTPTFPGGITGAAYWQKANSLNLADAAAVTTWTNDIPGGGNNFAASAGTVTFSNAFANWMNFNPSVTLNATGTLSASSFITANTYSSAHIFTVKKPTAAAANNSSETITAASSTLGYYLPYSGDNRVYWDAGNISGGSRIYTSTTPANMYNTNLWSFYADNAKTAGYSPANTVMAIRQNGLSIATGQSPSNTVNFTGNSSPALLRGQGNIAEAIEYLGNALTATQINQVESYLALKYGLSLNQATAQNYTASDGTTIIWNGATGSSGGFKNNIFGIGTDLLSGLNQRISRSINTVGSSGNGLLTVATSNDFTSVNSISRNAVGSNMQFLMIADNGLSVTALTGSAPIGKIAVPRQWQVQSDLTGSSAVLQFDVDNSTGDVPLGPSTPTYYMLYNAAGGTDFTSAAVVPLTLTAAGLWSTTTAVALENGSTFTLATSAVPATGLNFDGTNDAVLVTGIGLPLANTARTIEAWIRTTQNNGGTVIMTYGNLSTNNRFGLYQTGGKLNFVAENNDYNTNATINDGVWHYVAAVFDGTSLKVYLDGAQVGTTQAKTFNTTGTQLTIGYKGNASEYFLGDIDEVRIWNRALCLAEIQNNKNAVLNATDQTGLVALYHFDQGNVGAVNTAITTLTDATGNGNTGTLGNFALTGTASNWVAGTVTGAPTTYVPSTLAGTAGGATISQLIKVNAAGTYFQDAASCGLIAKVLPSGTSAVAGNVNAKVTIDATVKFYKGAPYVQRHFDIEPATGAATATATVTLYYTQAEFTAYNTARGIQPALPTSSADATGIANLRITQLHGTGTAPGNYTGSTVIINPSSVGTVVWNSTLSRWEVTFPVDGFSGFFAHTSINNSALPLTLIRFSAAKTTDAVLVSWQTSNEQNVHQFEIERSTNGSSFDKAGTVTANNITGTSNYQFTDNTAWISEQRYYRLKSIDNDGAFKYSAVVIVNNKESGTITVYPNPAKDVFTIRASDNKLLHTQATLTAANGKAVKVIAINNLQQTVNVAGLPAGIYMLRLANGTFIKLIKE